MKRPIEVEITTYQVGFGDCFLLKVHYDKGRPHTMLIDFGSMRKQGYSLTDISKEINSSCPDGLDVVVATHRHQDHVQGFARTKKLRGTGKVIRDLNPRVVIQPWTEDPKAQPDATRPTKKYGSQGPAFAARLHDMQSIAETVHGYSKNLLFHSEQTIRKDLRVLGENNLKNASAMENLRTMGKRHYYAYHGMKLGLSRELPGVKIHVLGPPSLEQTETILKQRRKDEDEFWHLQARSGAMHVDSSSLFPGYKTLKDPIWGRWARRKFRKSRAEQLLSIVRSLDHALNNTSLILLLQVGKKRFLFPGDAQQENWNYALSKSWVRKLLRGVDVYKVGHHGSLNATPKSMFNLFDKKQTNVGVGEESMFSLLSSKEGVHGKKWKKSEVPRTSLVNALSDETQLISTLEFENETISESLFIPV